LPEHTGQQQRRRQPQREGKAVRHRLCHARDLRRHRQRRARREQGVALGQRPQRQGVEPGREHQHRRREPEQAGQCGALRAKGRIRLERADQAHHQPHHLPRLGQCQFQQPRQQAEPEADHRLQEQQPQRFGRLGGQCRQAGLHHRQHQCGQCQGEREADGRRHLRRTERRQQHERATDARQHQHGVEDEVGQRLRHRAWPPSATMRSKSCVV
jgi:hypothetical protein